MATYKKFKPNYNIEIVSIYEPFLEEPSANEFAKERMKLAFEKVEDLGDLVIKRLIKVIAAIMVFILIKFSDIESFTIFEITIKKIMYFELALPLIMIYFFLQLIYTLKSMFQYYTIYEFLFFKLHPELVLVDVAQLFAPSNFFIDLFINLKSNEGKNSIGRKLLMISLVLLLVSGYFGAIICLVLNFRKYEMGTFGFVIAIFTIALLVITGSMTNKLDTLKEDIEKGRLIKDEFRSSYKPFEEDLNKE
ncbi:MAG: hypothetical protein IPL54_07605 [Chitinophagaceae bacterium]|nr:hypothetical protein [Chitinophagaceae bacterium]